MPKKDGFGCVNLLRCPSRLIILSIESVSIFSGQMNMALTGVVIGCPSRTKTTQTHLDTSAWRPYLGDIGVGPIVDPVHVSTIYSTNNCNLLLDLGGFVSADPTIEPMS
jgi:hypothetical protein